MNLSHSNRALWVRPTEGGGEEQALMQLPEVESAVEAVSESGEIAGRIPAAMPLALLKLSAAADKRYSFCTVFPR